ncbi:hypothetical protein M407DRAFT_29530 [Tulasnella calospora MUT 4182]|uniref:F-box domain-containing protein n=1 Tax=Tulasnella calospora MUT 4182 TaxID=1051891 RepID=A0A0C3PZF3_9AGAM|nr:hypothetical protein M407DRAFT_29530 [Tulasnella calospora MUT 4182]
MTIMTRLKEYWRLSSNLNLLHPNDQTADIEATKVHLVPRGNPLTFQVNSQFAQLPEDIIFLIMAHLNKDAQASLIRTCRYLHHLLEVSLYRHITLPYPQKYDQNYRLFRTLVERQDLIPCIVTYHGILLPLVAPQKKFFLDRLKHSMPNNFWALPLNEAGGFRIATAIFAKATNIVDLELRDCFAWESDPLFDPIKKGIARMSLRRLALWYCPDLLQVLRDQHKLEELQVGWGSSSLEKLERTDVPELRRCLSTQLQDAAYLVPGRPIEQLELDTAFGSPDFDERLFNKLSLSTAPITDFSGIINHPGESEEVRASIRAIARILPNIEKLTLRVGGSISGQIILDEIPSLQSIRVLAFLRAELATAEDRADSADHLHSNEIAQSDSSMEGWDGLFAPRVLGWPSQLPLGTQMFELSPRREPPWDVVDHKEVAPVPSYLSESGGTIVSILPNDVSRTFTFNFPCKVQSPRRNHSRSSSVSSISSFLTLSRSSSNASSESEGGSSTASRASSRKAKEDVRPTEFGPQNVRDAIVFARNELLGSIELRKLGANVFCFEGWSVTKFRKGSSDQYRLQVCYTGRPAKAVFPSGDAPPTVPPFLDVTEGW